MEKNKLRVGLIGTSERPNEPVSEEVKQIAYRFGYLVGLEGFILFSGGRDGVMEAASHGNFDAHGINVGILPSNSVDEANPYVTIPITTGLGMDFRSILMIHTVDVTVMIGGKIGTLLELVSTYQNGKPAIVIRGTGDFADSIEQILIDGKYFDSRKNAEIYFVDTPEEAIKKIKEIFHLK
ncbi:MULTISPECIES: TIGR00725 family protein [Caldisericum]|jgi:uncharacterized protein (TIGR00725 family)|uniref:TIGR00725 family protein n=1 Tax=Caldisericum exile TaxID=693075 RepID=A0A2J6WDX4_9BACT|nr:MAG: TIGR00725 family protein [Caldisericum exile]PMP82886.1 MAG: TIGR00725 family protein [Caldisericum exile]